MIPAPPVPLIVKFLPPFVSPYRMGVLTFLIRDRPAAVPVPPERRAGRIFVKSFNMQSVLLNKTMFANGVLI